MVMTEVLMVLLNGTDDVPLHDLHMVDVVKKFEMVGTNFFAQLDAPSGVVAHVIGVVHSAVQQLHIDNDVFLFCNADNLLECCGTILQAGFSVDSSRIT